MTTLLPSSMTMNAHMKLTRYTSSRMVIHLISKSLDELIESSREHIAKMRKLQAMQAMMSQMGGGDYGMNPQAIMPQQMQNGMGMMEEGSARHATSRYANARNGNGSRRR